MDKMRWIGTETQCPRMDLNKRFLPKPMTTIGWKGKESKSQWIEILYGGSQFTLWFLKIKKFQKFSDHSEFFFALQYLKNWTKVVSWKKKFCSWKKKFLVWKKLWKKKLLVGPTVEDFNASWFWLLRGSPFTLW